MAPKPTATVPVRVVDSAHGQEVVIEGRIDVRSAADLRLALRAAISEGFGDLHLHLGDVEIGDATGLGVLLESHRRARREGRRLVLASITHAPPGYCGRPGCTGCSTWRRRPPLWRLSPPEDLPTAVTRRYRRAVCRTTLPHHSRRGLTRAESVTGRG
jgi:anti-anti-sigma factor